MKHPFTLAEREFASGNNSDAEAREITERIETMVDHGIHPCMGTAPPALAFGASLVGPWLGFLGNFVSRRREDLCFEMLFVCVKEDGVVVL